VYCADVVEISSSDDDIDYNDDDIELLRSDDKVDEASDGETETSGNHVDDALNQHDASGRVLVNIGHPPDEPDIFLAPQTAAAVKPHQVCSFKCFEESSNVVLAMFLILNLVFADKFTDDSCRI